MQDSSRRAFLAAAGTGVAAAGVAALVPSAQAATPAASTAAPKGAKVDGPVVAYVHNAKKGEVAIMHGEREVVVTDHDLVARLTSPLAAKKG